MTPDQVDRALDRLTAAFPERELTEASRVLWREEMTHVSVDLGRTAIARLVREGDKFPTIAAFFKAVAADRERLAVESRASRDRDEACNICDGHQWMEDVNVEGVIPCPVCLPHAHARIEANDVAWRKGPGYPPNPTSAVRR